MTSYMYFYFFGLVEATSFNFVASRERVKISHFWHTSLVQSCSCDLHFHTSCVVQDAWAKENFAECCVCVDFKVPLLFQKQQQQRR